MSILTQSPYVIRFENILESLQSKLSKLETKLDSINDSHPDKQQSRLNVLEEISKTKQDIENTQKNLECSKTMNVIRSDKVPSGIPDHKVWNDCWYDEKRKSFVTFNKYFEGATNTRTRDIQIQYDKDNGNQNSGVILEEEKIQFRFGYPSIKQKDLKGREVWFILPTITDEMLTDEIVISRIKPKSSQDAILYDTQSEQWITVGTDGFSMCEKENEISDKLRLFPSVPIEELRTMYGRK